MTHSHLLLILVAWLILYSKLQAVVAQVSIQNPLIWQTLVTPWSNTYDYVPNATTKYYSQDFQTIFSYNDNFGHNERILLNVGDGCNVPSYDDIVYYNNGVSSFLKRQLLMGLVSRGGCSWSTKINNLQTLVQVNSVLTMTGVLIYDNVTYDSNQAPIIQNKPSSMMAPIWDSSQLVPTQRNISNMPDNDIIRSNIAPFMAIYFVSHQFGLDMLAKMNASGSSSFLNNHDVKQYIQLAPYFSDIVEKDNPSNNSSKNDDNGNGDSSSSMGTDDLFGGGNRGYIAYLVAAVAGIVMAIILFRWCRNPRFGARQSNPNDHDPEAQIGMERTQHTQSLDHESSSIPVEKLDAMYSIKMAGDVSAKMKNSICAICLDDFDPTCQIRLLPCHHGFCVGCIDIWLTKKSSLCPICKHDCGETAVPDDAGDLGKMSPTTTPSSSSTPIPSDENHTTTSNAQTLLDPSQLHSPIAEQDLGTPTTSSSVPPPSYTPTLSEPRPTSVLPH